MGRKLISSVLFSRFGEESGSFTEWHDLFSRPVERTERDLGKEKKWAFIRCRLLTVGNESNRNSWTNCSLPWPGCKLRPERIKEQRIKEMNM